MKLRHLARVAASVVREAVKRRTRSPKWRAVEKAHLKRHPSCAACGGRRFLQVHHVKPFAKHPELELEPSNLITLCMGPREDHLRVGHLGRWTDSNPNVVHHAAVLLGARLHMEGA